MVDTNNTLTTQEPASQSVFLLAAILVIIGTILIAIWFFAIYLPRHIKAKEDETNKKCIYPYLQKFDVEDIDIRRAPTMGWHGTYLNKLAYGINDFETLKRSDSDYSSNNCTIFEEYSDEVTVNDSLFIDATVSIPYLGNSNQINDANDFGLTAQDSKDERPRRMMEDETI